MPAAPRSCWPSTISQRCARRACACMSCPPAPGGSRGAVQSRPRLHASLRAGRCAARCAGHSVSGAPSLARAQVMMDFLKEWEEKLAIKITCSQVRRPPQPRDHSQHPCAGQLRRASARPAASGSGAGCPAAAAGRWLAPAAGTQSVALSRCATVYRSLATAAWSWVPACGR